MSVIFITPIKDEHVLCMMCCLKSCLFLHAFSVLSSLWRPALVGHLRSAPLHAAILLRPTLASREPSLEVYRNVSLPDSGLT